MKAKEDLILETVIKNLITEVKNREFVAGDIEQWSNYAKRLVSTINGSVEILKTLIEKDEDFRGPQEKSKGPQGMLEPKMEPKSNNPVFEIEVPNIPSKK